MYDSQESLGNGLNTEKPERVASTENQCSQYVAAPSWQNLKEIQDEGSTGDGEPESRSRTTSNHFLEKKDGYSDASTTGYSKSQFSNPAKNLITPKSSGFNSIKKILRYRPMTVPLTSDSESIF